MPSTPTRMANKALRIAGQVAMILLSLLFSFAYIDLNIPGHQNFCDADQIYLIRGMLILIMVFIGFLINAILFLWKKHWVVYRKLSIAGTILIVLAMISTRSLITHFQYGEEVHHISNLSDAYVLIDVRLFENGTFISSTYDASCNRENTGTYDLNANQLNLKFDNVKSEYLETRYAIHHDTLVSESGDNEKLIIFQP